MSTFTKTTAATLICGVAFCGALALTAGTAVAQQAAPGAQPGGDLMQQVQQKQAEMQQINQQLAQIQEATLEANPELADQRDALIASVDEKMEATGHDPEASREKMEELQAQLQSGELSDEENQSVAQEMRREQSAMQQAQNQVLQDEDIQAGVQNLNEALVEAMREQNSGTDQLIARLQSVQQEYQALMQRAMQAQQQSAPPGGPGRQ